MGCGISKPEDGADSPAAGRPLHRRFEEIRRLRMTRPKKHSTVSNAHLLTPEDEEDGSAADASMEEHCTSDINVCNACGSRLAQAEDTESESEKPTEGCKVAAEEMEKDDVETRREVEEEIQAKEEEEDREESRVSGLPSRLISNDDELPGSPSFRVYFVGAAEESLEDDSLHHGKTEETSPSSPERRHTDSMDSSSSEEREVKTTTKSKGSRLRALARRHSAVHVLFKGHSSAS